MALSMSGSRNKEGVSRWSQLVKAFRRACILFALGRTAATALRLLFLITVP
jgi:hypothetical protein